MSRAIPAIHPAKTQYLYDLHGRNVQLALGQQQDIREKKPRVPIFSKPHQRKSIFDQQRNSE